jgi:hypothetical protein
VQESSEVIKDLYLIQNFPNPFNPTTIVQYNLPTSGYVTIKVYDVIGREVSILVEGIKDAGCYSATFDGAKLTSGIYFARFTVAPVNGDKPFIYTKKMLLEK